MSILNLEGAHENELVASGEFNLRAARTAFTLPNGQRVVVPTELLVHGLEGTNPPVESVQERESGHRDIMTATGPTEPAQDATKDKIIPLVEEQMQVFTREVETGRVRLRRDTQEQVQTVSVPLTEIHWEVEHVAVGQVVDAQPEVRRVGETMIFPLVEERLVVKRELWLREEVHVRRVSSTTEKSADFAVKRDVLIEERSGQA